VQDKGLTREELELQFLQQLWAYLQSPSRPAYLAGRVYNENPVKLRDELLNYLAASGHNSPYQTKNVISIMCPHIDFGRGYKGYAATYRVLEGIPRPDVIFLLGTSHQQCISGGRYYLTKKSFETPFGTFPVQMEVLSDIVNRFGEVRSFSDEILHRTEHSLELQLPFLALRFEGNLPPIVPILVGSFHDYLEHQRITDGEVEDFVGAVTESVRTLRQAGKRVLLYSGVDLAHMGMNFGDTYRVCDVELPLVASRDHLLLEAVLNSSPEQLFVHMAEDLDRRRICGFPSLFTQLLIQRAAGINTVGHLLEYQQAVDYASDCTVTFASGYWEEVKQ
jgi:AmmeMemoRadiSam system protein B